MRGIWKVVVNVLVAAMFVMPISAVDKADQDEQEMKEHNAAAAYKNNGGWTKLFGGNDWDLGMCGKQTNGGGYIITGGTSSYGAGNHDVWLIKTDANGDMIWNQTFGGKERDLGRGVIQTSDGGYLISATTYSFGAQEQDGWIIKTDAEGNRLWDKIFGSSENDWLYQAQESLDGGYMVAGDMYTADTNSHDACLIKIDDDGNTIWKKTFGGNAYDWARYIQRTSDGGYILTGGTASFSAGGNDVWLLKVDADGNKLWDNAFGGPGSERGKHVQQTSDDGYIITGYTYSYGEGYCDAWLIKTDAEGNKVWAKTYGGSGNDTGRCGVETSDGGYAITGYTNFTIWLLKADSEGNKLWEQTFGRTFGYFVQETTDGSLLVTGEKDRDVIVKKVSDFPPNKPTKPTGPSSGEPGTEYTYTTSSIETNNDEVYYKWNWGVGTTSDWLGPYHSGETIEASYTWKEKGDYTIKVKAKDAGGQESPWSDPLAVSIPKTYERRVLSVLEHWTNWLARLLENTTAFLWEIL